MRSDLLLRGQQVEGYSYPRLGQIVVKETGFADLPYKENRDFFTLPGILAQRVPVLAISNSILRDPGHPLCRIIGVVELEEHPDPPDQAHQNQPRSFSHQRDPLFYDRGIIEPVNLFKYGATKSSKSIG